MTQHNGNEKKKFKIPNQIDPGMYIWRDVRLLDLVFLTPLAAIGWMIYYLSSGIDSLQVKMFFSALPLVLGGSLLFIRPLRERKNVRLYQYIMWRAQFNKRQRLFYFQKKVWTGSDNQ